MDQAGDRAPLGRVDVDRERHEPEAGADRELLEVLTRLLGAHLALAESPAADDRPLARDRRARREAAVDDVAREPVRARAHQRLLVAGRQPARDEHAARAGEILGDRRPVLGDATVATLRRARRRQRSVQRSMSVSSPSSSTRTTIAALRRRGRTVRGRRARHPRHGRRRSDTRMASRQHAARERTRNPPSCASIDRVNVLALYDIHGNIDALDAVLADPRAANPDVVLVGGDVVPGPFARATLDRLNALETPAGCAATASARWPRRSTAPSPPPTTPRGSPRSSRSTSSAPRRARAARRPPAHAGARRRPLLPRDAARRRRDGHAHLAPERYAHGARRRDRADSSSPATPTSSTTSWSAPSVS